MSQGWTPDYCKWTLVAIHGVEPFSWEIIPAGTNGADWYITYFYETGDCDADSDSNRIVIVEASGEAGTFAAADVTVTDACGNSATIQLIEMLGGVPE